MNLKDTEDYEPLWMHDKKYHPEGYEEGDQCKYRENLKKQDDADHLDNVYSGSKYGQHSDLNDRARSQAYDLLKSRGIFSQEGMEPRLRRMMADAEQDPSMKNISKVGLYLGQAGAQKGKGIDGSSYGVQHPYMHYLRGLGAQKNPSHMYDDPKPHTSDDKRAVKASRKLTDQRLMQRNQDRNRKIREYLNSVSHDTPATQMDKFYQYKDAEKAANRTRQEIELRPSEVFGTINKPSSGK